MVETPQTSGFTAATSEDKDDAAEDDPGPSFLHLLTEHDGWREIDGAEAAVRRVYDAAVAMLPDMLAERDVSVVLSSDEAVAALNARYRGKNRPTNVLSFPAAPLTPGAGPIEGERPPLGDVIIARETLISEATDEKTPLLFHLSHLTVHGLLHLAGFDHETDREAERMEALERLILASIGIPDPYSPTPTRRRGNPANGRPMAISNSYSGTSSSERHEGGSSWLNRLALKVGLSSQVDARTVIKEALNNDDGTAFSAAERAMLQKTLHFKELRVEDVMVPRSEIVAIEETATLADLLAVFAEGHSRVPVYRDNLDEPVGMVHVKDLMSWVIAQGKTDAAKGRFDLAAADLSQQIASANIMRDLIFAPPSMSALDLLIRMQGRHTHLALIIDEHGGTDGLVSIEDLLEEVVGNIEDEHDSGNASLISQDAGGLIVDARAGIEDVEARIGLSLSSDSDDDVDTLGGLVFTMLGRVPARGEIVRHSSGLELEVLDADRRRAKKLKLRMPAGVEWADRVPVQAV